MITPEHALSMSISHFVLRVVELPIPGNLKRIFRVRKTGVKWFKLVSGRYSAISAEKVGRDCDVQTAKFVI